MGLAQSTVRDIDLRYLERCEASRRKPPLRHMGVDELYQGKRDKFHASYYPFPEAIYVHDNTISGGGTAPSGEYADALAPVVGKPMPAILFDGIVNPQKLAGKPTTGASASA